MLVSSSTLLPKSTEQVLQHALPVPIPQLFPHSLNNPDTSSNEVQEGFRILTLGTSTLKVSGVEDLRLVWLEDRNAFQCFRGWHNLSHLSKDLQIVPGNITLFMCAKESGKILIRSLNEHQHDVSLVVRMEEEEDVAELFSTLLDKASHDLECEVVSM